MWGHFWMSYRRLLFYSRYLLADDQYVWYGTIFSFNRESQAILSRKRKSAIQNVEMEPSCTMNIRIDITI